ncbi:MAG: tRNA 2-thiouridine(34) synthase MnmA [Bacteroidales bacterium]|nr:tRNA 2-thiouridine(34) synthase MnmA [Bacteroidales bacterium]
MTNKKVLLAMSGGTDSSVAAILLKECHSIIEGITFISYDSLLKSCNEKEKGCCNIDSIMMAKNLADKLNINHNIIDLRDEFEQSVIKDFISEYMSGNTPNPCVLCNKTIKWGKLFNIAKKTKCDFLATGHYAQVVCENGRYFIRKGVDTLKDQSYFLWMLSQENLAKTIFPLGGLRKNEVREIAIKNSYDYLAQKKESQEICFIPNDNYRTFLRERIPDIEQKPGPGNFVNIEGKIIGQHKGFPFYTIGQRKGLEIAMGYPVYVLDIDADTNTITLGDGSQLLKTEVWINRINFMKYPDIYEEKDAMCKIRYNNKGEECYVKQYGDKIKIEFKNPVSAVTPGQSAVIYEENDIIAGGIIMKSN